MIKYKYHAKVKHLRKNPTFAHRISTCSFSADTVLATRGAGLPFFEAATCSCVALALASTFYFLFLLLHPGCMPNTVTLTFAKTAASQWNSFLTAAGICAAITASASLCLKTNKFRTSWKLPESKQYNCTAPF